MEDFYDIKTSTIDGRSVCLFGIFDGKNSCLVACLLTRMLNLSSSPGISYEK